MSATEPVPFRYKVAAVALVPVLLISIFAGVMAYNEIPAGHVGVEKEWSAVSGNVYDSGQAWTVPVKEGIQVVEIRPRTYTMSDSSGEGEKASRHDAIHAPTVNGTDVRIDVTVRYNVNATDADKFVREWNNVQQAEKRLIRPSVRSALRDEAASIPTSEIYTKHGRERLGMAAREVLADEFEDEALELEAVQVRNVKLPQDYQKQLNQKEIAKQKVKKEQYKLQKAKKAKERKEVNAEAEARQIEIKGEALEKNPEVLRLRYIEALKEGETIYVPAGDSGLTLTKEVNGTDSGN